MDEAKQAVREGVWDALDAAGAVRNGTAHGRIPDFRGAQRAADRLAGLPGWRSARVVKAVPDKAQHPARVRALHEGKTVYMAVPRLAAERPFYLLDPARLPVAPEEAASGKAAATVAPTVDVDALRPVDVLVCGSVAVDRSGTRIGKGAGYSDLEFALLAEAGLIRADTLIVTTVHPLQVVEGELPRSAHDFGVDAVVTPEEVITCRPGPRPTGLLWDRLDAEKIAAIPLLAARARERGSAGGGAGRTP